jgi:ATP-dependent helicase/nuclease subunit B
MKALLARLGLERADVQRWPHAGGGLDGPPARASALLAAMAPAATPAATAAHDGDASGAVADLGDVWLAEAATAAEEAQLVALALREALEVPGRRAALVTPDPQLARRVAAHCRRWGIAIDDSAGTPLALTPPGALAGQLVDAMAAAFAPHQLLAVLKHRLVTAASADAAVNAGLCDLALRGVRPPPGLDAAGEAVARWASEGADRPAAALARWWQGLSDALAPLEALREAGTLTLPALMAALRHAAQALCGDAAWSGTDGRLLAGLVADIEEHGHLFGPFVPDEAPALFAALIAGQAVRVPGLGHPRLAILGPLEAQGMRADLMVLAGLNEGSWPPLPAPDPWLAPAVRARLGLPGTALAQGLSVQDFLRAACAPQVLITRARRDGTAPRLPSRLWLRLIAHFGPTLRWRHDLVALARAMDAGGGLPARVAAPAPAPPPDLRPRSITITEIDTLIADPFAFHARRILKLAPLDPLDQDPTAAMRGTLAHKVMERWIKAGHGSIPQLDAIIAQVIDGETGHFPLLAAGWAPRIRIALRSAGDELLAREAQGWTFLAEVAGRIQLPNGITLRGRVDRLDRHADGRLVVVDYKTGRPPATARVLALEANQLALGLAMAAAGALEQDGAAVPAGTPAGIEYVQLVGRRNEPVKTSRPLARSDVAVADHIAAALDRAEELTSRYLLAATPFKPKLRPQWAWGDYDHLARVAEWINRAPAGGPA